MITPPTHSWLKHHAAKTLALAVQLMENILGAEDQEKDLDLTLAYHQKRGVSEDVTHKTHPVYGFQSSVQLRGFHDNPLRQSSPCSTCQKHVHRSMECRHMDFCFGWTITSASGMSSSDAPPRNWRGIGLAVLVITVVMSLVLVSILLFTPENQRLPEKSPLTLSDLENMDYQPYTPLLFWASDSEIVLETRDGSLIQQNLETKKSSTLLSNITLMSLRASHAQLSLDLQNVLLVFNKQQILGVSRTASYTMYNIRTRMLWDLKPPGKNETILQYAAWGPHGSQLIFIFQNDIYYQQVAGGPVLRLTSSGDSEALLNGITDWTYEAEVLHSYAAHWWSPDGARLAYLSINNTHVPNMELPYFVGADYPSSRRYFYPKAGQPIPLVKVFVVNLYGPSHTLQLLLPDIFEHREYYITLVSWVTNTRLAVQWLSRSQNFSLLTFCDATTGACIEKYRASSDVWISIQGELVVSADAVFLSVPVKQGARGEFLHVAMLSPQLGGKEYDLRMLTSGDWDVTRIVAYNQGNRTVYFLSTEDMSRRRHLYSVDTSGSLNRTCVSCDLVPDCHFVDVVFSPGGSYFILYCKGPGVPQVSVHQTHNPRDFIVLEENQLLKASLSSKDMPETEYKTIHLNGYDLPLHLTLPSGYQDSRLPLVLCLPETPGSQQVTEEFSLGWESVLVSSFQIILARFDGRGSRNRGLQLLHETDRKLGSVEIKDLMALVQHLKHLPFVDSRRIGVFGKAYGGFLALKLLAVSEELFVCSVAVAPITHFQLHSAVISERYLGMPIQDDSAYTVASVLNDVQSLREQQFLLVHGTADANVHFQHTAELLNRLIMNGANVTTRIYPDEDHFFLSKGSQHHLQQSIISYLQRCLQTGGRKQRPH
ncbi:inactive dipeptidyl peptidase 10-like [Ascaphus truei]|uniref:inactive dipeptidyl peptidase 10-like n=1 Tax=Ascaphus truei TaxID=8439 RepID=UPI003F5A07C4